MKKKVLSFATCAMMTIAGLSGVKAVDPAKHEAVIAMKACMANNNDCSKFTGAGIDMVRNACLNPQEPGTNPCIQGCKMYMTTFSGEPGWCK